MSTRLRNPGTIRWGRRLLLVAALTVLTTARAAAQASPDTASPPAGLPSVPTTKVLAVGRLGPQASADAVRAVLDEEVRHTVRLHLSGKIEQWYFRKDQPGVVFLLNATDLDQARSILEPLALNRAGLMVFDFVPLGPLAPLGLLLAPRP